MIDPLTAALDGMTTRTYGALPLAALAGLASSIGPCAAPRYLAVAALCGGRRGRAPVIAYAAGLVVAYVALGFAAGALALLAANLSFVYATLAVLLLGWGTYVLCDGGHRHDAGAAPARTSGSFVLGSASTLVISPCCVPMLLAVAGLDLTARDPLLCAAYLGAFAVGHAAPVVVAGTCGTALGARVRVWFSASAASVVSGALAVALGGYYGLLV